MEKVTDKRITNKAITRLTQKLRVLASYNPNMLTSATIFLHGFDGWHIPPGFVLENDEGSYKVYKHEDENFTITIFT